ncbi:MAG TPA: XRE family transcriptional regulator [Chloroflexota bacterium]|nr:XRE family transcriptional regulator [Chloroflexota bacterium]
MTLDDVTIGARLQIARKDIGLTQGEVGKQMELATSTVSEIEAGKRSVTGGELHQFARLYHRPLAFFFEHEPDESPGFGYLFREADLSILDRSSIVLFHQLVRDYTQIEEVVEAAPLPLPPDYSRFGFRTEQDAETLAEMERGRLGLGDAPVKDLMNLLDAIVGIKAFLVPVDHQSWSGIVARDKGGRPCVAVNAKEESYRRNFALAHEYGHVLAHLAKEGLPAARIDRAINLAQRSADESFANAFASAFLMPRPAILGQLDRVLGANSGQFTDADLAHLAMQFGVSGQALSARLVSLRKLPRHVHDEYWNRRSFSDLAKALGYELEDWSLKPTLPARFRYLALKAFEESRISLTKLAELLRVNSDELRRRLRSAGGTWAEAGTTG